MQVRIATRAGRVCALVILSLATVRTVAATEVLFDPPDLAARHFLPDPDSAGTQAAALVIDVDGASVAFDFANQRVVRLSASGDVEDAWPATGSHDAQLGVDGQGRVYLSDRDAHVLRVFDPGGSLVTEWPFGFPLAGITNDGRVVAQGDFSGDSLRVLSGDGQLESAWVAPNLEVHAVTVDGSDVWALGVGQVDRVGQVQHLSLSGELISEFKVDWDLAYLAVRGGRVWTLRTSDGFGQHASLLDIRAYASSGVPLASWERYVALEPYAEAWAAGCAVDPVGNLRLLENYTDEPLLVARSAVVDYEPIAPGVIVVADPAVTPFIVDGTSYVGTQRFDWTPGGVHNLAMDPAIETSPGTRQSFVSWSDGGSRVHDVMGPSAGGGILLCARTEHFVDVLVDSGGSASAAGWIQEGTEVELLATPAPGYRFVKWSEGPADGTWHDTDRLTPWFAHTVTEPESWEACFVRQGLVLTISASDTDPWVNSAAPTFAPRQLFLWGACLDRGISALEADVATSMTVYPFVPANGGLNGGGANLYLAIPGCPIGAEANVLLGSWWVFDDGGAFCLQPSAANGILGLVDCPALLPRITTPSIVGFSSIGEPCRMGPPCGESVDGEVTGTPEPVVAAASPGSLRLAVQGNPFRGSVSLSLDLPAAGRAEVRIYDVTGRLVRTLQDGTLPAGRHALTWDGRTAADAATPAGVYFARLEANGARRILKLVRLP